jgi:hypothetical protein
MNIAFSSWSRTMSEPEAADAGEPFGDDLEADVDTVIAACGGNPRAAVRALLIANEFLTAELERSRATVSTGYIRKGEARRARAGQGE